MLVRMATGSVSSGENTGNTILFITYWLVATPHGYTHLNIIPLLVPIEDLIQ